jgi:hypothetical protein
MLRRKARELMSVRTSLADAILAISIAYLDCNNEVVICTTREALSL